MNAIPSTNAERAGKWFGRARRAFGRNEARAIGWLASRGLPRGVAWLLLWSVKLAVLLVLLYAVFWIALAFVLLAAAAWFIGNAELRDEDEEPEWRIGWDGYGLYRRGVRVDAGSSDDEEF